MFLGEKCVFGGKMRFWRENVFFAVLSEKCIFSALAGKCVFAVLAKK